MKKTRMVIGAILLSLTMSVVPAVSAPSTALAACSDWTIVGNEGNWYCETRDGCGFLWLQGTMTIRTLFERYCNESGKQVRETKYGPTKNGCC